MKRISHKILLIFMMLMIVTFFTGCTNHDHSNKTIESKDGKTQVIVPENWKKDKEQTDKSAIFLLSDDNQLAFSFGTVVEKSSSLDFGLLVEEMENNTIKEIGGKLVKTEDKTIHGLPVKWHEVEGTSSIKKDGKKISIKSYLVIIEGTENIYVVFVRAAKDYFKEHRQEINKAVESFQEVKQ